MNWLQLRSDVQQLAMQYDSFNFPLRYDSENECFVESGGLHFNFAKPGYNYLIYRLENQIGDKKQLKELYDKDKLFWGTKVSRLAEQARQANTSGRGWITSDSPLIAPIHEGLIYGLMTKYNAISNLSVMDLVEKWGMVTRVTDFALTATEFNLFLSSEKHDAFDWGMAIRNGETGHTTLGYWVYIKLNDYTFSFPFENHRRHMSRVNEVNDNLQDVFETVHEIQLWRVVETLPANNYAQLLLLNPAYGKLHEYVTPFTDNSSLVQLIFKLSGLRKEKGLKTVSSNALDMILGMVGEDL